MTPGALPPDNTEVFIRKHSESGDVILSRRPPTWDHFLVTSDRAFACITGLRIEDWTVC